jgi:hypothetical protein
MQSGSTTIGEPLRRRILAVERKRVLVFSRDTVALGDDLRRFAQRDLPPARHGGVHEAPAQNAVLERGAAAREVSLGLQHHVRRSGHALDAAGDEDITFTRRDGVSGTDDRLQA